MQIDNNNISPNIEKFNITLLENPWIKEENTKEFRKFFKWYNNENKTSKLLGGNKRGIRRKFIALNEYIIKERYESNALSSHVKKLEKEKQSKSKISRNNEIIELRA